MQCRYTVQEFALPKLYFKIKFAIEYEDFKVFYPILFADSAVSKILYEFLEVAVNAILYSRDIYPRGSFDEKKKYGIPVQVISFLKTLFNN